MSQSARVTCLMRVKHVSQRSQIEELAPMSKPYISYIDPATMKDAAMLAELERCRTYGTPRPESQAIRAHVPAVFWSFANSWRDVFHTGIADHGISFRHLRESLWISFGS